MPGSALKTPSFEASSEWPDFHSSLPEYAARFPGALGQWILKIQTELLMEAIAIQADPPERGAVEVLDVGGGHGQVTPILLELEKRVATVVSDAQATSTLTKMLNLLPPTCMSNYVSVVSPLDRLPFEHRSVPQVISLRMVCHMHDWRCFISELCRVASSQVIVDYPSLQSANYFQQLFFKAKLRIEGNTRNFRVFDDREIVDEFRRNGFNKFRTYRQFTLPLALHRAIKNPKVSEVLERIFKRLGVTKLIGSPVILSASR
jgi:SAM-dependent methyltransferase